MILGLKTEDYRDIKEGLRLWRIIVIAGLIFFIFGFLLWQWWKKWEKGWESFEPFEGEDINSILYGVGDSEEDLEEGLN